MGNGQTDGQTDGHCNSMTDLAQRVESLKRSETHLLGLAQTLTYLNKKKLIKSILFLTEWGII